jgi:hypothetical protein
MGAHGGCTTVLGGLLSLSLLRMSRGSLAREVPREVITPGVFYDAFSTRLFDPQGRVLQLEYALQATQKGGAAVRPAPL